MRQVPSKLTAAGPPAKGLRHQSEIEVIHAKLIPNHANSTQEYKPIGVSRINFRIPSYSSYWMDNSRSFISYKLNVLSTGGDVTSALKMLDTPGSKVGPSKTAQGWCWRLSAISTFYKRNLRLASTVEESSMVDQGNYSHIKTDAYKARIGNHQTHTAASGETTSYIFKFNTGIISQHLTSYIPLHMIDGNGSFALDLELKLADTASVLEWYKTAAQTLPTTIEYVLSDVV